MSVEGLELTLFGIGAALHSLQTHFSREDLSWGDGGARQQKESLVAEGKKKCPCISQTP